MKNSISLIVPVFNEEGNIDEFIMRSIPILKQCSDDWAIIFINDGSTDNTLDMCLKAKSNYGDSIRIIDFSRNFGKENALSAGLEIVDTDCAIPIDVDLQDPPELILDMYNIWKENDVNMIYAKRSFREGEGWFKKKSASLFYKLINKLSDIDIPENVGDFRLIDKKVIDALKNLPENNRFMKGLFSYVGFKQQSFEFVRKSRRSGVTKFNFTKLSNLAIDGITSFSSLPLRLSLFSGILVGILSFIFAFIILINTLIFGIDVPGYSSLIVIILFLGAMQLIALGIIGEYIGKIFNEVKRRPLYIINKIY